MFEVEAKVRLSEGDFKRLRKELPKVAKKGKTEINKDFYYSEARRFFLRLRDKNGEGLLNIKSKTRGEGIEANQEIELKIKSVNELNNWLRTHGIKRDIQKTKESEVYEKGTVRFELNFIEELGYFLEIEILVKKKEGITGAKRDLQNWFKKFGFNPSDYESKYYLELLSEIRKNG